MVGTGKPTAWVECKHGLRNGCGYCHKAILAARFTKAPGKRQSVVTGAAKYAEQVALAMDRRGPLAMRWNSDGKTGLGYQRTRFVAPPQRG